MSHFSVGVLIKEDGKKLEELLAPYQDNNMGDCPKEYLKFIECDKDEIDEYEEHKDEYNSLEEFMEEYHGYEYDVEIGKYGYWENPNSKWDWYEIGGRFSNRLITKDGSKCSCAKLKDIDWNKVKEFRKKKMEELFDNTPNGIMRSVQGILEDDTRESFSERESIFATYAVITPDGKWNSKDKMGLFGVSSEDITQSNEWDKNYYNAFIKDADQDLILAIVDCHI